MTRLHDRALTIPLSVLILLFGARYGAQAATLAEVDASRIVIKSMHQLETELFSGNLRFSPDGKRLLYTTFKPGDASGSTQYIVIKDVRTRKSLMKFVGGKAPAWSPDGKQIAFCTGSPAYELVIFDLTSKKTFPLGKFCALGQSRFFWAKSSTIYLYERYALDLNTLKKVEVAASETQGLFSQRHQSKHPRAYVDHNSKVKWWPTGGGLGGVHILPALLAVNKDGSYGRMLVDQVLLDDFDVTSDLSAIAFVRAGGFVKEKEPYIAYLGTRDEKPKTFRVSASLKNDLGNETYARVSSLFAKGVPIRWRVYSAKVNPLNNKVVGADRERLLGLAKLVDLGESSFVVRGIVELQEFGANSIVTDIHSWTDVPDQQLRIQQDAWGVLQVVEKGWKEPVRTANVATPQQVGGASDKATSKTPSAAVKGPAQIRFENRLNEDVIVSWIDGRGNERPYRTLRPGQSYYQMTSIDHVWKIRKKGTNALIMTTVADQKEKVVTISGDASKTASAPAPQSSQSAAGEPSTDIRSGEGRTPAQIIFRNRSTVPLGIYWVDYQGNEKLYADLRPGQSLQQRTYLTHVWRVRDKRTNAVVSTTVADKRRKLVEISGR